jgi:hypothetical protein
MIIEIGFTDFKKFVEENNKRIYFFINKNMINLYFITESIFTCCTLDLDTIDNKELFFGHKIFLGATKLLFDIKNNDSSVINNEPSDSYNFIKQLLSAETKDEDIQKEGVDK